MRPSCAIAIALYVVSIALSSSVIVVAAGSDRLSEVGLIVGLSAVILLAVRLMAMDHKDLNE